MKYDRDFDPDGYLRFDNTGVAKSSAKAIQTVTDKGAFQRRASLNG